VIYNKSIYSKSWRYTLFSIQKSTGNSGSPFSIINWVKFTTAWKKRGWRYKACLNLSFMQQKSLIRLFTVSCLAKIFFFCRSPLVNSKKCWSRYPPSAKAFSPGWRRSIKAFLASRRSVHSPHGSPPLAQTISPVRMHRPIS
jgi:hypothetical protein